MFENYIEWTISIQAPNRRRLIDYPIWSRIFNIFEAREILNFSFSGTKSDKLFKLILNTQWRGKQQVLKILDILYKDSTIYLQRKYNKYLELRYSQSINEN